MLYVIQVFSGYEDKIINQIKKEKDYDLVINDCFSPIKKELKKYKGEMHECTLKMFPGYIFIETSKPRELPGFLYRISYMTNLLGVDKEKK